MEEKLQKRRDYYQKNKEEIKKKELEKYYTKKKVPEFQEENNKRNRALYNMRHYRLGLSVNNKNMMLRYGELVEKCGCPDIVAKYNAIRMPL